MLPITSSSMTLFRFSFRFLLLICCIITITSYKLDHRTFDNRNERAVTEWRFRRNYLFSLPYFYPNNAMDDHLDLNEIIENENERADDIYDKKYIPNSLYDRMNE